MKLLGATPSGTTDAATKAYVDSMAAGGGMLAPVRVAATGTEYFTIASGSVTQITGTTTNGVTPDVGDRILIMGAPESNVSGTGVQTQTWSTANGIYVVTGNTTNLSVSRDTDMSGSVNPLGLSVYIEEGSWVPKSIYTVDAVGGSFAYGTAVVHWIGTGGNNSVLNTLFLGNTTDTTLSRSSAGVLAVEGVAVPTISSADTLTNKTINETNYIVARDDRLWLVDSADTSKLVQFQLSGITASTTRTLTVPDADTTLVGHNTTQTLTNKTISGSSNTLTNVGISSLSTTGSPSSTTFLRGDGSWAAQGVASPGSASVDGNEPTSSTSYVDLATTTDTVTVTVGSSGKVLVFLNAQVQNGNGYISVAVSGASTVAASDANGAYGTGSSGTGAVGFPSASLVLTGLAAGSTTFKMKYRSTGGTVSIQNRRISVLPLDGAFAAGTGIVRSVNTLTGSLTLPATASTDFVYFLDAGAVATLPTAVSNTNRYTLKNIDTTDKTILTTSSQTIDGGTTAVLTPNTSIDVISDGSNWRVF